MKALGFEVAAVVGVVSRLVTGHHGFYGFTVVGVGGGDTDDEGQSVLVRQDVHLGTRFCSVHGRRACEFAPFSPAHGRSPGRRGRGHQEPYGVPFAVAVSDAGFEAGDQQPQLGNGLGGVAGLAGDLRQAHGALAGARPGGNAGLRAPLKHPDGLLYSWRIPFSRSLATTPARHRHGRRASAHGLPRRRLPGPGNRARQHSRRRGRLRSGQLRSPHPAGLERGGHRLCRLVTRPQDLAHYQTMIELWIDQRMDCGVRIHPEMITGSRLTEPAP